MKHLGDFGTTKPQRRKYRSLYLPLVEYPIMLIGFLVMGSMYIWAKVCITFEKYKKKYIEEVLSDRVSICNVRPTFVCVFVCVRA